MLKKELVRMWDDLELLFAPVTTKVGTYELMLVAALVTLTELSFGLTVIILVAKLWK